MTKEQEKKELAELLRAAELHYKHTKRCNSDDWPQAYADYLVDARHVVLIGGCKAADLRSVLISYHDMLQAQQRAVKLIAEFEETEHHFIGRIAQLDELLQLFE